MKKLFVAIICICFLSGCAFYPEEKSKLAPPEVNESIHLQYITEKATRRDISDIKEFTGEFVYSYYQCYDFASMALSGYSGSASVKVSDGQSVNEGDILIVFDCAELNESLAHARVSYEEISRQAKENPENTLLSAQKDEAKAVLERLQKQIEAQTIKAPFSGKIRLNFSNPQNEAEKAVTQVILYRDENVEFKICAADFEKELFENEIGEVTVQTADGAIKGTGTVRKAPMKLASGYSEEDKYYYISVDGNFACGEKGTFTVVRETHTDVLCIPTRAICKYKSNDYYVRCLASDGITRKEMPVEIGIQNEDFTEIKSGLSENDTVIVG